jgi:hypothetical protein
MLIGYLYQSYLSAWQDKWTQTRSNKLRAAKLSVQVWQSSFVTVKSKEAVSAQLGSESAKHTYHTYICCMESQLPFIHTIVHLIAFPTQWSNAIITINSVVCTIAKSIVHYSCPWLQQNIDLAFITSVGLPPLI